MSIDLFERYREALRRGHAAAARGELEPALLAYREAVALAPDRATPHLGVGSVLLRQGNAVEAVAAFDAAVGLAPRDEVALRGRADALALLGRRTEAADTLDILSDLQEAAGRLTDAAATGDRALEMAEGKLRRRRLLDLHRQLRAQEAPEAESAGPKPTLPEPTSGPTSSTAIEPRVAGAPTAEQPPPAEAPAAAELAAAEPAAAAPTEPASAPLAEPPVPVPPVEPRPDPVALVVEAERALDAGDQPAARRGYLAAAAAFESEGLLAAALDACYVALAFAPDDAELHLQLVQLYLELGWNPPAADKLALLARLVDLDGGRPEVRARIVGLAADRFPEDPRLRGLVAAGLRRSG